MTPTIGCFLRAATVTAFLASCGIAAALAQDDTSDLAAKSQNPIANLISLPVQANWNFPIGPHDRTQTVINVQPVLPFAINNEWTLVTRWIVPLINQPDLLSDSGGTFGLGDFNPSFFFATNIAPDLMIGAGPTFLLPTATSRELGNGKWGAGPTAVIVWTPKPWVIGVLANNIWSFAGDSDRQSVNRFLMQPFINYNLPKGWYIATAPIITADWKAAHGDKWTVPIGGGVGRVMPIAGQPVNLSLQGYYNVVSPDITHGPNWQVRASVALLFPK